MATRWMATACALLLILSSAICAQEPTADANESDAAVKEFLASLDFKDGDVALPQANAMLAGDAAFRFLGAQDSRRVLEDFWGNPPNFDVIGMLVPSATSLDATDSWAVVITHSDEGYVSDEEAAEMDYAQLLADMQTGTQEANEQRRAAGYGTVELMGWAEPPRYDAASRKLYWAKELDFGEEGGRILNYDVRVLGRYGFLSLNAVAGIDSLAQVREGMQRVLPLVEFNEGHRYADFNPDTDRVAAYGLAALIGGTLAAKSGLLAKIGVLLVAGKKIIIPLLIGLAVLIGNLLKRKKADPAA